jgi:hypothetical protein
MKKYVWAFVVSICVFLVCTYFVSWRVESTGEGTAVPPQVEHRSAEDRLRGLPSHSAPAVRPKSAPPITTNSAAQPASIVAIIQAISGLIAAITGLLGVIKGFRRNSGA